MTESWSIAHAQLYCNVRWDGANLLWQLKHTKAPGGATQWDMVGELRVEYRPARWTRLVSTTT